MNLLDKKTIFINCNSAYKQYRIIVVAGREYGVVLPDYLYNTGLITLDMGSGIPVPMVGLFVDNDGLSCKLSFNRVPFRIFVPWIDLIGVMTSDYNLTWPVKGAPKKTTEKPKLRLC